MRTDRESPTPTRTAGKSARPLLALTVGDPAGIGPEIVAAALADHGVRRAARLVVLGPARFRPAEVPEVARGPSDDVALGAHDVAWCATDDPGGWEPGRVQAGSGRAALAALELGARWASEGRVDGLVTAPVSKEALHLAGERVEGQTELLGRWAGTAVQMLAIAGELRVGLLTRHMPLADALAAITTDGVVDEMRRLDRGLRTLGFASPRLALAGLNPHAGEAGLLGSEERELLEPAVRTLRAEGLDVAGPESPDSVFLRGARGEVDAVLALYHDQAFIPVKLLAPMSSLTVLLGLPYLRVSPAHGTAFGLVGRGVADPASLIGAIEQAARWAPSFVAPPA